jgi:hypothetical protein
MGSTARELEVVAGIWRPEHDAIESIMVFKGSDDPQPKTAAVHVG